MLQPKVIALGLLFLLTLSVNAVLADFGPGDIYSEYPYVPPHGYLRVGGKLDYGGTNIKFIGAVDLDKAIKAEVNIAKLLCHDDTRGLAISVNNKPYKRFPEGEKIPSPQYKYQHMIYPTVSIPLSELIAGVNVFKLKVDESVGWWPQNLIYGAILRVYYSQDKPHPTGTITSPAAGSTIDHNPTISVSASDDVIRTDFIGYYEDFNWEGDGVYTQWHYIFKTGAITYHIGSKTGTTTPSLVWDTEWIPDQPQPIKLMARLRNYNRVYYNTPAVTNINLVRPGRKVELCKSYNVPQKWVTRKGAFKNNFNVSSSPGLAKATAARLLWCSWSPAYARGVGVNGKVVIDHEGPHYGYYMHKVPFSPSYLKTGVNEAFTNKTPLIDGEMVHGMEVNWPGLVVQIKYVTGATTAVAPELKEPAAEPLPDLELLPNPVSVKELTNMKVFCLDGRAVIPQRIKEDGVYLIRSDNKEVQRLIINNK